jgi:membrane protein required for colicin V production
MFNVLDLVILGVLVLSAVLAAWRGFTHEVLSIGSWVGAAIVMFVAGPYAEPLAAVYVEHDTLAKIVAYAAVFVIALIPLSYISYRIAQGVRGSAVGPVDRLLGLAFGAARGLVVIGVGFLVFTSLVGENRLPDWFKEAKLRPLMEGSGKVIASLMPARGPTKPADPNAEEPVIGGPKPVPADKPAPDSKPAAKPAAPPAEPAATPPKPKPPKPPAATETARPAEKPAAKTEDSAADAQGYGERERDALDQLIGTATASPAEDDAAAGEGSTRR